MLATLGALPPLEGVACAQDFAAAGAHFEAAQQAFSAGKFKLAADEFQAAYSITKDPALLFNIGESWQRAGEAKKALDSYRSYLKEQPSATDRAEVESRIQALEAALAPPASPTPSPTAAPTTQAPAAGTPPAGPAAQSPGTATAAPTSSAPNPAAPAPAPTAGSPSAPAPGPGEQAPAAATLTPPPAKTEPPAAAAPTPQITPPEPKASKLRTAAWVSVASAVAVATAGAIVGLGAQNRADELRRRTTLLVGDQPPVYDDSQRDAYETLQSDGRAYSTASIALLSVAGAAAVTGGVLFIADYLQGKKSPEAKPKVALVPVLGIGQALLVAGGSF